MRGPIHQLRIPEDVACLIKALKDELEGLRSFRVGRFRIIYRIATGRRLDLIALGARSVIYEETYRRIAKS